ncbi:CRISPR-associated protein Csh1 [Thomasclavelia cocleata]|uniref:CRISPR-associated protein Csh1 n=2 Tax=Thomasclavelia cocleata TaxID=69824 RepID=A0A1I0EIR7_9FIRM|nr:hypothetical protein [Thomasclavelia cocleata]MCR1959321.1 hypothetical protein [Thomasclavelia cocleata]NDO42348.1 hypothetical protein [Thomasclavelia cocleata]SET44858.1 CRISPR-associated protein Csh1 [Thomasclavelia cocleata]
MLDDCLRIFKQELKDNRNLVLDTIILADGDYVLVHGDGTYDVEKIKYSKRDHCLIEKPEDEIYDKLCFYDYQSQLVSMNKPQDPGKTIHSNNYLSLFVKKESFNNGKMNDKAIERYFKALENPQDKYKGKDLQMYNFVNDNISEIDQEKLLHNKQWLKEHIYNLEGVDYNEKDYLKIFFEVDDQLYIDEGNRYLLTKIFNCNDYNVYDDGTVYGLPNYNLQLNAKKPFLENKTRMHKIPYMVSLEDALLQKQFFDYLLNRVSTGKSNVYINEDNDKRIYCLDNIENIDKGFNGFYLKTKKGKELEIHYMDVVTDYKQYLNPLFDFENIIGALDDECYREYKYRNEVEKLINNILFSKYLINNYFTAPDDIKSIKADSVYKKNLLTCRNAIFAWTRAGRLDDIGYVLPKAALEVVINSIRKEYIKSAQKQLNLYFALNKYFNKQENGMEGIRESLRTKINSEHQNVIENDLQYSFAVGQIIYFLQTKSKAKKRTQDFINQFIIIRNDAILKNKLRQFYRRYNYEMTIEDKRFKNLYGMVELYLNVGKIDQGMLLAGYLGENLIYEKGEKENG